MITTRSATIWTSARTWLEKSTRASLRRPVAEQPPQPGHAGRWRGGPGGRPPPAHQRPAHRDHGHRRDQQRHQDPHPGRLARHQVDDFHQRDELQPHGTVQHRVARWRGQLRGRRRGIVAGGCQRRLQPRGTRADAGDGSGDGDRQHPDRGQDPAVGERPALSGHRQPGEDQQPHAAVGEALFGQLLPGAQLADGAGAQQPGVGDQLGRHAAAEQHQPDQVPELQPGVPVTHRCLAVVQCRP